MAKNFLPRFFLVSLLALGEFFALVPDSFAQTATATPTPTPTPEFGMGTADAVEVTGENVINGTIVSFSEEGYTRSKRAYDPTAYGIVTTRPAVTLEVIPASAQGVYFVLSSGKTQVQVSSVNGTIKTGDQITSSDVPGVGMKSTKNGYVIGTALEDYTNTDPNAVGQIQVNLNFAFNANVSGLRTNLLENLDLAFSAPFLTPTSSLRYLLAGLMLLIAFGVGIGYFGRTTQSGVEALGRNPLAGRAILASVVMNMILAMFTISAGIAVGFLILTL